MLALSLNVNRLIMCVCCMCGIAESGHRATIGDYKDDEDELPVPAATVATVKRTRDHAGVDAAAIVTGPRKRQVTVAHRNAGDALHFGTVGHKGVEDSMSFEVAKAKNAAGRHGSYL